MTKHYISNRLDDLVFTGRIEWVKGRYINILLDVEKCRDSVVAGGQMRVCACARVT